MDSFLQAGNTYPPFMILLYWPLSLLSENIAYIVFTLLLQVALFLSVALLLRECDFLRGLAPMWTLAAAVALWAIFNHTYPVLFALERGSSGVVAVACSCAFFAALRKERFAWATGFLFLAVQIKIYTILLAFLLLGRAGWKYVALLGILNLAALFALGWAGLANFLEGLRPLMREPNYWPGNHSLQSYFSIRFSTWNEANLKLTVSDLKYGFLATFAGIWLYDSIRRGNLRSFSRTPKGACRPFKLADIALIGMATQLMCLLPGTSHDYKLVVQIIPTLLLLARCVDTITSHGTIANWLVAGLGAINALLFAPYQNKMPLAVAAFFGYMTLWVLATRDSSSVEADLSQA